MASQDLMSLIHQAGFTGAAANTMYGIVMAESGGNAQAHNGNAGTGDNSYGLAQINMLGSMGPQRLQQFGLTSNEQLFDPLTNLKVAYKLSGGGQNFSPWTTFTSGAYRNAAPGGVVSNSGGGGSATTMSASSQSASLTPVLTPAQQKAALIKGAGPLGAVFTHIPELNTLLSQAVSSGWTAAEFQNAIDNSAWYRTHSDNVRQQILLRESDPTTFSANVKKETARVSQMERQLGVRMNGAALQGLAEQSLLAGGWDQQTLQNAVGALWRKTSSGNLNAQDGQAAQLTQQIKQIASEYGLPVTDYGTRNWVSGILSGVNTIDGNKQAAIAQAKSLYAPFAKEIDSGMTMKQIADPYVASMSNLLELNPNSINFASDPMVKKALQGAGATAAGQPPTATPLWQFEQQVRADPRWQYTTNAHNDTAGILSTLGKDWGMTS